jgi:hypothetical protein
MDTVYRMLYIHIYKKRGRAVTRSGPDSTSIVVRCARNGAHKHSAMMQLACEDTRELPMCVHDLQHRCVPLFSAR